MKKALIVYYSMDGNTKQIAERIKKAMDADIMMLDTVVPYTGTDDEIVKQCEEEVQQGYRPELKPLPYQVKDYDTILIGTPTWWYTAATPVFGFMETNSWDGKRVVLFQTHCGWPGHGLRDMAGICKGADIICEKAIQFNPRQFGLLVTPDKEVQQWIDKVRLEIEK